MTIRECDRCGNSSEDFAGHEITGVSVDFNGMSEKHFDMTKDLCNTCKNALVDFFKPLPKPKVG